MFKPQFSPLVLSGAKRQTIRPFPKRYPREGEQESWREWTGLPYRSPQRELAKVVLTEVQTVIIHSNGIEFCPGTLRVSFFGEYSQSRKPLLDAIAVMDGFANWEAMRDWFKANYKLPFKGIMIRAKDL
jgi:hypothetical protein